MAIPPEHQFLLNQARLGIEAEQFLESPLGVHILQKAQEEQQTALKQLAEAAPTDAERIQALQNAAKVPSMAVHWLLDLAAAGTQAEQSIRQLEDTYDG